MYLYLWYRSPVGVRMGSVFLCTLVRIPPCTVRAAFLGQCEQAKLEENPLLTAEGLIAEPNAQSKPKLLCTGLGAT